MGGSFGGTDSTYVMSLDNCEIQSINYNIAAAHSRLGNTSEVNARNFCSGMNFFHHIMTLNPILDNPVVARTCSLFRI